MTKAALDLLGQPGGTVRGPLLAATEAERHQLVLDLVVEAAGVKTARRDRYKRVSYPHRI